MVRRGISGLLVQSSGLTDKLLIIFVYSATTKLQPMVVSCENNNLWLYFQILPQLENSGISSPTSRVLVDS